MILNNIRLFNYAGHRNLPLQFKPGFNCLVGVNGSGKTSILKAITDALVSYTNEIPGANNHFYGFLADDTAYVETKTIKGKLRFEPQFPSGVEVDGSIFQENRRWVVTRDGENRQLGGDSPGQLLQRSQMSYDGEHKLIGYPLVSFYRANRHWAASNINQLSAATAKESRLDGYLRWFDASTDTDSLQRWVISKSLERLEYCVANNLQFNQVQDDELAVVNHALSKAMDECRGLRYDMGAKTLLMEWDYGQNSDSEPTAFVNLSDGQRAFIGLVTDIARRMCLLNPQMGLQVTSHTPGVVLIDELDMHLHPRWQRIIAVGLKKAFPSIQFIVASHSPLVLGSLHTSEIILLQHNGTSQPSVSYGMEPSEIIQVIMGADIRPDDVKNLISAIHSSLESNDLSSAKNMLIDLKKIAPGISDIASAEALLKRKEILGR